MGSCWRRLSYPRGNFSVISRPHQEAQRGSLGPAFTTRMVVMPIRVKEPFALALYERFLTALRFPLGAPDIFSGAWRPTQTAHLRVSCRNSQRYRSSRAVFHRCLHPSWRPGFDGSRLPYTRRSIPQPQAAVKLNGVFASLRSVLDCALVCYFHRIARGDSGALVGPFMQAAN
jgi:hypothetical protein